MSKRPLELLEDLKSKIPNSGIYFTKNANSEKLGLETDKRYRTVYILYLLFVLSLRANECCFLMVIDWHFWNPGVISYAMIPSCGTN
jgi:hypothetical protein